MSVTRPRGPLPARVYWVRRLLVLSLACALVFGIGKLLEGPGASDPAAQPASLTAPASDEADEAASGSAGGLPSGAASGATSGTPSTAPTRKAPRSRKTREPLAMPTGPCQDSDVQVAPAMDGNAYAGSDVRLRLRLTTAVSPACNWEVSAETIAVKVTSGNDRIWTSQECPGAVPTEEVVLRQDKAVFVEVTWSGRRSDPDCSRTTLWAEPGYYHLATAAMGAEPSDEQFRLLPPAPVTITPTPTPSPTPTGTGRGGRDEDEAQT